jgi:hypothetical protein
MVEEWKFVKPGALVPLHADDVPIEEIEKADLFMCAQEIFASHYDSKKQDKYLCVMNNILRTYSPISLVLSFLVVNYSNTSIPLIKVLEFMNYTEQSRPYIMRDIKYLVSINIISLDCNNNINVHKKLYDIFINKSPLE